MDVLLWAYAYEFQDDSLVSDAVFDQTCLEIDLSIDTDRPDLDEWFRKEFFPDSGMWVRSFPELDRLHLRYVIAKNWEKDNV